MARRVVLTTAQLWTERARILSSRDRFDKLGRFHSKGVCQCDDVKQTDIAFSPFDSAHVVAMEIRQLRQGFLRKPALCPQFADTLAK